MAKNGISTLKPLLIALAILAGLVAFAGCYGVSTYNRLVRLDQEVSEQWAQVENTYQRRADLVPNLVATVKGAAVFERETLTQVIEARSRATQQLGRPAAEVVNDPAAMSRYEQAQDQLSSALSRLLVVVERYPDLRATEAFRDLMAQLEGTENRIAVERMRYNQAARRFNAERNSFPTNLIASVFGSRFEDKAYFRAAAGATEAPKVDL